MDLTQWGYYINKWVFQLCLLFNILKLDELIPDYGIKIKVLQQRECNIQGHYVNSNMGHKIMLKYPKLWLLKNKELM